jgi:type I restriction enzyme, S subunit
VSELPASWIKVSLGEIAQIEMGQSPDSRFYNHRGEGLPFFQGKAEFGALYPTVRKWCLEPKKIAEPGDILLSVRAPVGPTNLANEKCCIGRGLAAIRGNKPIVQEYLLHFFRHIQPWLSEQGTGTTFTAVSGGFLRTLQVTVAPLNEQKRISNKLNSVLARAAACLERFDRVPAILKRFRQSVLAAATSGKLTQEWREETKSSQEWNRTTIGALLTDIRYGTAKKCRYEPKRTPVLRIPNVIDGRVSHDDMKYAEFEKGELRKLALAAGDILMIRSNGSLGLVGRTALVTKREADFLYAGYLIRLRLNQALAIPDYVSLSLTSPASRDAIEHVARSTSGVNNINTEEIKALSISVPSVEEQGEIVHRVGSLFAYSDRLEARYTAARSLVERLKPALLRKAFRGELVPQDPNDENASDMLGRIRATQAKQAKEKMNRRKNRPISKAKTALKRDSMKTKPINTLSELSELIDSLGGKVAPDRLLTESALDEDIDKFFELLREGRDKRVIDVPVGHPGMIQKADYADR